MRKYHIIHMVVNMKKIAKSVIQQKGKYLVIKRSPDVRVYPNLWDIPGGKFEPGETAEQTVVRETKEEVDLDIEPGTMIKTGEYHDTDMDLLFHFFEPVILSGEIKLSHEHVEMKWATEEEIVELDIGPSLKTFFGKR